MWSAMEEVTREGVMHERGGGAKGWIRMVGSFVGRWVVDDDNVPDEELGVKVIGPLRPLLRDGAIGIHCVMHECAQYRTEREGHRPDNGAGSRAPAV